MGVFDRVYARCPNCRTPASVEFQSKAGDSCMAHYTPDDAPPEILADIAGRSESCGVCGYVVTARLLMRPIVIFE